MLSSAKHRNCAIGFASYALALWLAACGDGTAARKPLPDWSDGYERGDGSGAGTGGSADPTLDPGAKGTFAVVQPSSVRWPVRIRDLASGGMPCSIEYDPSIEWKPGKNIECVIEHDELDVWALGLSYDIVVPKGMCDFILHVPYIFMNFEVGQGPGRVAYTVHEDGTFSDEVNSENGVPTCEFDYSKLSDTEPNCCTGTYALEVTSTLTGETSVSMGKWGGKPADCYYGAGYVQQDARFSPEGFPMPYFVYIGREAHVEHVVYDGLSDKYPSNIALANYWDPADHDGGPPAGLLGARSLPYYEVYCLDDADETIAHIQMLVREWNEEVAFDDDGDSDTTGTEPGWDLPINDVSDWADETPGGTGYPEIPIPKG